MSKSEGQAPEGDANGHLRVEWSPAFWGEGDFDGPTEVVYIPLTMIEEAASRGESEGDGVELAFGKLTHQDPIHILHYTFDESYTAAGELIVS